MHMLIIDYAYIHINTYKTKKKTVELYDKIELCRSWLTDQPTNINKIGIQAKAVKPSKQASRATHRFFNRKKEIDGRPLAHTPLHRAK